MWRQLLLSLGRGQMGGGGTAHREKVKKGEFFGRGKGKGGTKEREKD